MLGMYFTVSENMSQFKKNKNRNNFENLFYSLDLLQQTAACPAQAYQIMNLWSTKSGPLQLLFLTRGMYTGTRNELNLNYEYQLQKKSRVQFFGTFSYQGDVSCLDCFMRKSIRTAPSVKSLKMKPALLLLVF